MRLLLIALTLAAVSTYALEPISGTYYCTTSEGRWTLVFSRNGTYDITNPRGKTLSGNYNSTTRELALIEGNGNGERRHFRYYRYAGQLTLESSDKDNSTSMGTLNRMPPGIGSSATWYDRPVVVAPPRPEQPILVPPSNPGWRPPVFVPPPAWNRPAIDRINEYLDKADRSMNSARQALRAGDRRDFLDAVQRAQDALREAENNAR